MVSLAARYERGEHVAVWEELRYQPVSAADAAGVAEAPSLLAEISGELVRFEPRCLTGACPGEFP